MDLSIIPLLKGDFFKGVISNKLLNSMAAGIPVILFGSGESAEIVKYSGAGFVIDRNENELEELKKIIDNILLDEFKRDEIGLKGRNFILRNFTREKKTKSLTNFLRNIKCVEQ